MSIKKKNIIDVDQELLELESNDFQVIVMNYYQFRVSIPNVYDEFYDWYHTRGIVVVNRKNVIPINCGKVNNSEELMDLILRLEKKRVH